MICKPFKYVLSISIQYIYKLFAAWVGDILMVIPSLSDTDLINLGSLHHAGSIAVNNEFGGYMNKSASLNEVLLMDS